MLGFAHGSVASRSDGEATTEHPGRPDRRAAARHAGLLRQATPALLAAGGMRTSTRGTSVHAEPGALAASTPRATACARTASTCAALLTTTLKEAGYRTASFGILHRDAWGGEHDAAASHENQAALAKRRSIWASTRSRWSAAPRPCSPDYTDWLAARCTGDAVEHALDQPSGAWRTWNSALTRWHQLGVDPDDYLRPPDDRPFLVFCSIPDPHPRSVRRVLLVGRRRCWRRHGVDAELDRDAAPLQGVLEASGGWFAHFDAGPAGGEQRTGWKNC